MFFNLVGPTECSNSHIVTFVFKSFPRRIFKVDQKYLGVLILRSWFGDHLWRFRLLLSGRAFLEHKLSVEPGVLASALGGGPARLGGRRLSKGGTFLHG